MEVQLTRMVKQVSDVLLLKCMYGHNTADRPYPKHYNYCQRRLLDYFMTYMRSCTYYTADIILHPLSFLWIYEEKEPA